MDKTKIAVDLFNKLANGYQDKFMDVSLYHQSFDVFCDSITKQHANILELACGPGNITKYLLQKRPDFIIEATDLAPNMIELAKINNPTADFHLMDCRDLDKLNKQYDGIMCGFCLPYLSKEDAIDLISKAYQILNTNGVLYISTMEDDYSTSGLRKGSTGEEIFMHYHQADYLLESLNNNGFKVLDLQRKEYSSSDGSNTVDLLIIASK